jgi:acetyltransferase-like isoleucine patch superfamily enzyme
MQNNQSLSTKKTISTKKKIFFYFLPITRIFFSFFFDKKYLRGKYFDNNDIGWRWAWRSLFWQKLLGFNRQIPWPASPFITINNNIHNIIFDIDDINIFQMSGNYFQNFSAKIIIGKGTWIAPNVAIITANHDFQNLNQHQDGQDVIIGNNCWIGINSVILPGVNLGDNTIVGAGSIVTKSFVEGNVLIAGNPAKIIKKIN